MISEGCPREIKFFVDSFKKRKKSFSSGHTFVFFFLKFTLYHISSFLEDSINLYIHDLIMHVKWRFWRKIIKNKKKSQRHREKRIKKIIKYNLFLNLNIEAVIFIFFFIENIM